jgi:hypothetical protein
MRRNIAPRDLRQLRLNATVDSLSAWINVSLPVQPQFAEMQRLEREKLDQLAEAVREHETKRQEEQLRRPAAEEQPEGLR